MKKLSFTFIFIVFFLYGCGNAETKEDFSDVKFIDVDSSDVFEWKIKEHLSGFYTDFCMDKDINFDDRYFTELTISNYAKDYSDVFAMEEATQYAREDFIKYCKGNNIPYVAYPYTYLKDFSVGSTILLAITPNQFYSYELLEGTYYNISFINSSDKSKWEYFLSEYGNRHKKNISNDKNYFTSIDMFYPCEDSSEAETILEDAKEDFIKFCESSDILYAVYSKTYADDGDGIKLLLCINPDILDKYEFRKRVKYNVQSVPVNNEYYWKYFIDNY